MAAPSKKPVLREIRVPQQDRSRKTRERVLHAAIECFDELGYDETTTAEIARRAGIGVGTLYGYFRDKRDILLEILEETVNEIANYTILELQPEAWQHDDPREHVRALIDALFHTRRIHPGMQRILWERYFKDPEFRAAVQQIEHRIIAALVSLLESLRAGGKVRISDSQTAAFVVHSAVEWTASRLVLSGDEDAVDRAVVATSDMVSRFLFD
jgi:AcrR family transcriptional regulator